MSDETKLLTPEDEIIKIRLERKFRRKMTPKEKQRKINMMINKSEK